MTPPILAAYHPRPEDRGPAEFAAAAARAIGAPLAIVTVHSGGALVDVYSGAEVADLPRVKAKRGLDDLRTNLAADGLEVEVIAREALSPARGISEAMQELHPLFAVIGSTQRGALGRVLPGSTAERVVHGAECPVVVVPTGYEAPSAGLRAIGAAFIPTADGREALKIAAALARSTGARLRVVSVMNPNLSGVRDEETRGAEQSVRDALTELREPVDAEPAIVFDEPAEGLIAASAQLDLLVIGSRAYGPLRSVLLGGVSRRVIARAACPVLVLPRSAAESAGALLEALAERGTHS